ncbi:hypothetical protein PIB30_086200 [Stylosanthes scabra]|uniref:Uncharacterized protein n=1 Tax=Stylosanthes scabra TaxID=79078 RepID=A0ABU6XQZ3_9FABA|nr:hypothetical protein [Stylosanthes scabra]
MTSLSRKILAGGATSSAGDVRFQQRRSLAEISEVGYVHSSSRRPGIVLRQRRQWRRWAAEKASHSGEWESSRVESLDGEKAGPLPSYAVGEFTAEDDRKMMNRAAKVVAAAAVTVVMGVGNRVLYKLALVPLKQYPFFLAQLATFGYVLVYFSILSIRYHAGIVTDEMLSMPKTPFLVVGLLEALGAATGMAAGAMLSGASIPILSQTFLVWQILLSMIFLGRRYKVNQLLGCFLVATGVVITVASGSGAGNSLKEAGIFWSLLMIVSFLFQAADTVLKEVIFLDATRKLKGRSVDLFVVNSFGSAFQCRHYSYASCSHSYQNYGASPSVNYRTTSKKVQPAF